MEEKIIEGKYNYINTIKKLGLQKEYYMMKKILSILLICTMMFCLTACGDNKTETKTETKTEMTIGDTITGDNFEITLKSVEFSEAISVNQGSEKYVRAISDEEREADPEHAMVGQNGNVLLCYELEYKFIGTEAYTDGFMSLGVPTVSFDGTYTFSENYGSVVQDSQQPEWLFLSSDLPDNIAANFGIPKNCYKGGTYNVFEERTYTVRGFIAVPEKLKNEEDKKLTIKFEKISDEEFVIR